MDANQTVMWQNVDTCRYVPTLCHVSRTDLKRVLSFAQRRGSVTRREVAAAGIHTQAISRLVRDGALERVSRGRYRLPNAPVSEQHGLVLVSAAVPHGVLCLLSALSFHEIGTQLPHEVWIAIDRRSRRPSLQYPPLRVVRFGGKSLSDGIERHRVEGQTLSVYCVAKTLADLFKYRNKIGLDVALEALREAWRNRQFKMDDLQRYARMCRVQQVMKPYLEALVA